MATAIVGRRERAESLLAGGVLRGQRRWRDDGLAQMLSLIRFSRRVMSLTLKSTPIVALVSSGGRNSSSVKRRSREDLPTEDAPGPVSAAVRRHTHRSRVA